MKTAAIISMTSVLVISAFLSGCATQPDSYMMQSPSGQMNQMNMPGGNWNGAASGAQADALAREIVNDNNNTMQEFDQVDGRLDKMKATDNRALAQLEQLSNLQGTGQITLFFKSGSTEIDQFQYQRLVNFLDYLSRESRGRTVILLSIGSASAVGSPQVNKKLSIERSESPLPIINQYLVNVPHNFYKITGIGDLYTPKKATAQVEYSYQNVRIIAVYDASLIPSVPGS